MKLTEINRKQLEIAPSILAADFNRLGEEVQNTEACGVQILHFDVMDGHFVPNISFGVPILKCLRPTTKMILDAHLMISHPIDYVESFIKAGADHITFHIESESNPDETIQKIKALGATAGLSIKPGTPACELLPYLDQLDMVLIMTVEPGFGGQKFMPEMMEKVRILDEEITKRGLNTHIQLDGGINGDTIEIARASGANIFVAGTGFFKHPDGMSAARSEIIGNWAEFQAQIELDPPVLSSILVLLTC